MAGPPFIPLPVRELQWAWVAGLFEGEGHIGFQSASQVIVRINMTDLDVLERVDALFPSPGGVTINRQLGDGRKPLYRWQLSNRFATEHFLRGIFPWLGDRRRARAEEAFVRIASNPGPGGPRERRPKVLA